MNDHLLKKDYLPQSSTFLKNVVSSSQKLRPDATGTTRSRGSETKRESLNTSIPSPHFQSRNGMLNHTGGTYPHSGVMDYPRSAYAELNLGKFPDSMEIQNWKVNLRTEVCLRRADPQITMHWIKEVEMSKSIDELTTSRSIVGRNNVSDFDMLDAMIASCIEKTSRQACALPKKVSVEEQRAQKDDPFLRGRQIAYMICEHFRATRACEAVQGLSDLFVQYTFAE